MENDVVSEQFYDCQEGKEETAGEKKIEFNVNAKEFIPTFEEDIKNDIESMKLDGKNYQKPCSITKKIGEDYNPVFMDSMTEKFITEGHCNGNGREPEIPFLRYYSKNQAIDYFNRKYFVPEQNGDIVFKPCGGGEAAGAAAAAPSEGPEGTGQFAEKAPYGPENGGPPFFQQSNIFRPPIIDVIVQDILFRQRLAASYPKMGPLLPTPPYGRRGGKAQVYRASAKRDPIPRPKHDDNTEETLKNDNFEENVDKSKGHDQAGKGTDANSATCNGVASSDGMKHKGEGKSASKSDICSYPSPKNCSPTCSIKSNESSPRAGGKGVPMKTDRGSPGSSTSSPGSSGSPGSSRSSPSSNGIQLSVCPSNVVAPFTEPPKDQRSGGRSRGKRTEIILITDALPAKGKASREDSPAPPADGQLNGAHEEQSEASDEASPQSTTYRPEEPAGKPSGKTQLAEYVIKGMTPQDFISKLAGNLNGLPQEEVLEEHPAAANNQE